jgi:hypothetical protein
MAHNHNHNHGSVYQVKVIHQDGSEELSEWIEPREIPYTLAALHKPQATAYWLRERNITVPFCPHCQDVETVVTEYPVTDHLSPRSHAHDTSYLVLTGAKDSYGVPASEVIAAPAQKRTVRRVTQPKVRAKGAGPK